MGGSFNISSSSSAMASLNSFITTRRLLLSCPEDNSGCKHPLLNPNIAAVVILFIMAFFITLYISFQLYYLCTLLCTPSYPFTTTARGGHVTTTTTTMHFNIPYNLPPPQGLDDKQVYSLPKVIFSSSSLLFTPNLENKQRPKERESCVICLDEFKDEETLLLLPPCGHLFHPQCIKAWLNTHTTCPLCRNSLTTLLPHHPSEMVESTPSVPTLNMQVEPCEMESRWRSMDHPQLLVSGGRDTHHSSPLFVSNTIWGTFDTPSSSSSSNAFRMRD